LKSAVPIPSLQPEPLADLLLSHAGIERGKQDAVFICARQDGRKLGSKSYAGATWKASLLRGFEEVDFAKATSVEIALSFNLRKVEDFDRAFGEVHKGIRGIRLTAGSSSRTLFPSEMIATNTSFQRARERFADENKSLEIASEAFDAIQFLLFPQKRLIVPVYRGNQVVQLEQVTRENVAEAARLMGEWMANNVDAQGALTYKYWPSKGEYSGANNTVRQFMGTVCLYQAATFFNSDFVRRKAELNLAYNLARYFRRDGRIGYIDDVGVAKLGACALAAMAVLHEGGERFVEQEDMLFKLTKHLQQSDGSFITYYGTDSTRNQNFYTGECLLYWSYRLKREWSPALYERFRRSFRYYRAWHLANRNPAFVPWHTQACFMLYELKKDQQLKDWIFEMNDWLLPFQQWDQVKAEDCRGRFYDPDKPWGPPHASATGVYLEGLADAFQLAVDERDAKRAEAYALVIKRALRDVLQLQFRTDVDMFYISKRERVIGGLRTTEYNNEIRVDNVQHNLMALMKLLANPDFPW
jgi:hypothetical protein